MTVQPTTEPTPAEMEKAWSACETVLRFLRAHANEAVEMVRSEVERLTLALTQRNAIIEAHFKRMEELGAAYDHVNHMFECAFLDARESEIALAGEREARERAEQEAADALSLANEVALGITHSTICRPETLCVRCERDQVKAEVERLKADVHVRRGGAVTRA